MLCEFIEARRDEILNRARDRVRRRNAPAATEYELRQGLPIFLDQLGEALRKAHVREVADHDAISRSASEHGNDLFHRGLTIAQVVHDYGDLCQVITGLAADESAAIDAVEFQTLNLCLDDAIAGAVTAFSEQREKALADAGNERLGVLAHEMRNVLNGAMLAFASVKRGVVAPRGATSMMVDRSLLRLNTLIDRSLADVRLDAGMQNVERIPVNAILEEVEIGASLVAEKRRVGFSVEMADPSVIVAADRQILAAALANLVQNAFKFTRPGTMIRVTARATATRVLLEVEDGCGGLPVEKHAALLQPFAQGGTNLTGLGLGLAICVKAMKSMQGELHIRDLPGKGCVFTLDLPRQPPPPTPLHGRTRKHGKSVPPGASGTSARSG